VMKLLKRLNGQGMTVIMVTHSTDCAGYARRRLELSDGRLVESAELENTLRLRAVRVA